MKKAIRVFISIIMVFCLAGCTADVSVKELKQLIKKEVLSTADLSELGDISVLDYSCNGNLIAILYAPFSADGESEQYNNNYLLKTFLTVYNMKNKKLAEPAEVDGNTYAVKFTDGNIQLWSDIDHSVIYNTSLKPIGKSREKFTDGYDIANGIDTINTNRFICRNSYAYFTNYINNNLTIFYDDPDTYYINNENKMQNDLYGFGKTVFSYIFNDDKNVTLSVKDYDSKKIINEISLTTDSEKYFSISRGIIDENYAIFDTMNDIGSFDKLYYWEYNFTPLNKPFECAAVSIDEFTSDAKAKSDEIYNKYGVRAAISKKFNGADFGYECIDTETDAQYLLCLYDLDYCLSTFPKELYSEILCNDIENATAKFNTIKFYIVGTINDSNINAFAANQNDDLFTVFSASTFSYSTFCHEIMHQLEYRIWNYEEDFDYKWEELNPDEFYYTEDYSDVYYENEQYHSFFARDYGMCNQLEDRATVFEMYYDTVHSASEKWWLEHKPLNDKVNYLNEVIAKSFPSLNKQ